MKQHDTLQAMSQNAFTQRHLHNTQRHIQSVSLVVSMYDLMESYFIVRTNYIVFNCDVKFIAVKEFWLLYVKQFSHLICSLIVACVM